MALKPRARNSVFTLLSTSPLSLINVRIRFLIAKLICAPFCEMLPPLNSSFYINWHKRALSKNEPLNLNSEGNIDNIVDVERGTLERIFQEATEFLDFASVSETRANTSTDPNTLPSETIDLGF